MKSQNSFEILIRILGERTGENYTLRSFMICISVHSYQDDHVKKQEMVRACSMNWRVYIELHFLKSESNRQRGRPSRRLEDNIEMKSK